MSIVMLAVEGEVILSSRKPTLASKQAAWHDGLSPAAIFRGKFPCSGVSVSSLTSANSMPELLDSSEQRVRKRKRDSHASVSAPTASTAPAGEDAGKGEVDLLENQVLQSRRYYNNIATLINYVRHPDSHTTQAPLAAIALCRVFARLMASGLLQKSGHHSESEAVITDWLNERFQEYRGLLVDSLADGRRVEQKAYLELLMHLSKEEAACLDLDNDVFGHQGTFRLVLGTLTLNDSCDQSRGSFVEDYVQKYDDIVVYTFKQLAYVEPANVLIMYLMRFQQYARGE